MTTFNQANCTCTQEHVDPSCEVHGGKNYITKVGDKLFTVNGTDEIQLFDGTKVNMNPEPITASPGNGQDFGWLDELIDMSTLTGDAYIKIMNVKAAIIERFTALLRDRHALSYQQGFQAKAKQHQKDLLKARIDTLEKQINLGDTLHWAYTKVNMQQSIAELRDDLAKLEGESA